MVQYVGVGGNCVAVGGIVSDGRYVDICAVWRSFGAALLLSCDVCLNNMCFRWE